MPEDNPIKYSGLKFEFLPECGGVAVSDPNSDKRILFGRQDAVSFYYFVKEHLNGFVT